MKYTLPWFLVLFSVFVTILSSCSKPGDPAPPPNPPDTTTTPPKDTIPFIKAGFSVQSGCSLSVFTDTLQNLFQQLFFVNTSDQGKHIHYHWSFGDKSVSDSVNPTHTYLVAGTYAVQLITYYDSLPRDTLTRLMRIIIGAKGYELPSHQVAYIAGADNAANNGVTVLTGRGYSTGYVYALLQTDSILNKVYFKEFAATGSRLNSLQKTSSGNYILSGNYNDGNTNQYALSLIDKTGNLVWEKYITVSGKNYYTTQTSDGGYITIGDEYASGGGAFTTVVKCNSNGTEVWRKSFGGAQPYINNAGKIVETSAGFVFAALRNENVTPGTPELVVSLLDLNGNLIKQTTVFINLHGSTGAPAAIAITGNTCFAYAKGNDSICIFDKDLAFKETAAAGINSINDVLGYENNYYAGTNSTNAHGNILKIDANGTTSWSVPFPNVVNDCQSMSGTFLRDCRFVIRGSKDFIAISLGDNPSDNNIGVYLTRITGDGELR